ncbi:MAG: hypothetical protein R3C05_07710 [Pirellulaceae bacterium]
MNRTPLLAMASTCGGDVLAAVHADVGITEVIGEEDDNVGFVSGNKVWVRNPGRDSTSCDGKKTTELKRRSHQKSP